MKPRNSRYIANTPAIIDLSKSADTGMTTAACAFLDASTIKALLRKLRSVYSPNIDVLDERFVNDAISTTT
jgi:hypothetical protein